MLVRYASLAAEMGIVVGGDELRRVKGLLGVRVRIRGREDEEGAEVGGWLWWTTSKPIGAGWDEGRMSCLVGREVKSAGQASFVRSQSGGCSWAVVEGWWWWLWWARVRLCGGDDVDNERSRGVCACAS